MPTQIAIGPDDVLSTFEVCALAEITRQTLYVWIEQGKIKPWKVTRNGATQLFLRRDAEKLKGMKYKAGHD
ncbi:MAG: helix-turn-helix domain-containing protein [Elusimicrobiota bacterium]